MRGSILGQMMVQMVRSLKVRGVAPMLEERQAISLELIGNVNAGMDSIISIKGGILARMQLSQTFMPEGANPQVQTMVHLTGAIHGGGKSIRGMMYSKFNFDWLCYERTENKQGLSLVTI